MFSGGAEHDHAAALAAFDEVGKRLGRLVDRIGARDQFVELQPAAAVEADQARKILLRTRRPITTAGQCLLAERNLLSVQSDLILRPGDTDDDPRPAAAQDAPCLFRYLAQTPAIKSVIRTAARQLVQRLADIFLPADVERMGRTESFRQLELQLAGIDGDDHPGPGDRTALN